MKLVLEFYDALCSTSEFVVNGVTADYDDFGDKYDHDSENAEEYGCGDMHFDPKPFTEEVLNKYHITENEYDKICNKLEDGLSFGNCGWCI